MKVEAGRGQRKAGVRWLWLLSAMVVGSIVAIGLRAFLPSGTGASMERPRISGDFSLVAMDGESVAWSQLGGRRQLVFFGFSHCPEVCPTTLLNASRALALRGTAESDTRILFISVDPGRDTPQRLRDYVAPFGPAVRGFTGDAAGVAAAARAFNVYYEQMAPMDDGSYMVEHTATMFLLGPDDEILDLIPYGASAAEIADVLARH
ncbi:MAG: SCO family protein [Gammaproteobacteria bacterium]|nr:SCO family protein [Gammaproteobacteria bacterium]